MEIFLTIFYFIIFSLIIWKINFFNENTIPKYWFIIIFGIKIVVGIVLTSIYTYYYKNRETADIYKYFDASKIIFDALKTNPIDYFKMLLGLDFNDVYFNSNYYQHMSHWFRPYSNDLVSDSHIIIRFNAFVRLFSFGYFQVHNVFINFISLVGLTFVFKAYKSFCFQKEKFLFYAIFIIPSVLFWGSGVLKEGILIFAFGLFVYHILQLTNKFNLLSIIFILIALLLLAFNKLYIVVAFFIPTLGYVLNHYLRIKNKFVGYSIASIIFILAIIIAPQFNNRLDIVYQISSKQQTFSRLIEHEEARSGFLIPTLTNAFSIISNIPNALNNTLIRPYFWECNSIFVFFSSIENHFILLLIFLTVYFRKKINLDSVNVILFNITFIICLFVLIGLTTPVFGSIMRYKIPGLILLLTTLVMSIDIQKIKEKVPLIK